MKTPYVFALFAAIASSVGWSAEPNASLVTKVGVYDSRAVAYAYFWSPAAQQERKALIAEARTARAAHDDARWRGLNARLVADQRRVHLAVFSTAPAEDAMASLRAKLPRLCQELGVDRLESKWDERALREVRADDRVDVTDRLVRELFTPTPQQEKILRSLQEKPPLPLDEAQRLCDAGQL